MFWASFFDTNTTELRVGDSIELAGGDASSSYSCCQPFHDCLGCHFGHSLFHELELLAPFHALLWLCEPQPLLRLLYDQP